MFILWGEPSFGKIGFFEHKRREINYRKGTNMSTKLRATWVSEKDVADKNKSNMNVQRGAYEKVKKQTWILKDLLFVCLGLLLRGQTNKNQ